MTTLEAILALEKAVSMADSYANRYEEDNTWAGEVHNIEQIVENNNTVGLAMSIIAGMKEECKAKGNSGS